MAILLHAGRPSKSNSSSLNQPLTFKSKVKSSGYTQAPRYETSTLKCWYYMCTYIYNIISCRPGQKCSLQRQATRKQPVVQETDKPVK